MKLIHLKEPEHTEKIISKQAKTILKIKPDIILFEFPQSQNFSLSYFNKFSSNKKPKKIMERLKLSYKSASKKYPWLKLEYKIFEAIEQLWDKGKQVYLFEIDAPVELTNAKRVSGGLQNIVWNYLREIYMVRFIKKIIRRTNKNKIVLVLCHDFHWKNIQFLLKEPTKKEILYHYFIKNSYRESFNEIKSKLKKENKILYKYWNSKK